MSSSHPNTYFPADLLSVRETAFSSFKTVFYQLPWQNDDFPSEQANMAASTASTLRSLHNEIQLSCSSNIQDSKQRLKHPDEIQTGSRWARQTRRGHKINPGVGSEKQKVRIKYVAD